VAPRAYWKGYLKLSLVSCPVALFPASSEREKISFNQINKKTGHRIRYRKVDAETGEEIDSSDIIKGYEVSKGQYIEIEPEELEAIAIESKRTIEIDKFVPKKEIDELYLNSPRLMPTKPSILLPSARKLVDSTMPPSPAHLYFLVRPRSKA
jgi:DNA end-binding protein Ku